MSTVQRATCAIEDFLSTFDTLDQTLIDECDDLLLTIWYIRNATIRLQIIQAAALNVGLLTEDQLD